MEISNKRPLDNGYLPKYKPRRVSAIRHFPPGCGPHAMPVRFKTEENGGGEAGVVMADVKVECKSNDVVDNAIDVYTTQSLDALVGNITVNAVGGIWFDSKYYDEETCVKPKDIFHVRKVSAVRDFPPHCGSSASLLTEEERLMIRTRNSRLHTSMKSENLTENGTVERISPTSRRECLDGPVGSYGRAGAEKVSQRKLSQCLEAHDAEGVSQITPMSMESQDTSDADSSESVSKDTVDYSTRKAAKEKSSDSVFRPTSAVDRKVVYGLMASRKGPWRKESTVSSNTDAKTNMGQIRKQSSSCRLKVKAVAKKSILNRGCPRKSGSRVHISDASDEENQYEDVPAKSSHGRQTRDIEVNLPPFGPNRSGDIRDRVRDTLRFFSFLCRKILQRQEANSNPERGGENSNEKIRRPDLVAAKQMKGREVNPGKPILGEVPGVLVGDEFQYRVELALVGIHRSYQAGIDSVKLDNGVLVATSIVSSGAYADDVENADVLVYSGQGGNVVGKQREQPQDQKLERGNLALKNSIDLQTPVRVVRGWRDKATLVMTYVYDGLYTVNSYWTETGPHGKKVFMFELRRNPGQPELAWKELKKSKKSKSRPGICVKDISIGKERFSISAVNTLDDEKPPRFDYVSEMKYPGWHHPIAPHGCDCTDQCSDSKRCKCAIRNDGEIPYNHNGALVETKLLVYECGPHCSCPPSCYNRVSQRGIRYQLEIFKTKARGWGLRALTSIPSGGFICEYAGELLKDIEAEQRVGIDEYLFDIGKNLTESSVNPKDQAISAELLEDGGYTIDACKYGNVGRFINHSCTPNLYAQNVIFDHDDMKMPHIMLFAMENIPPLQELTYHYNYSVGQIRDSDGNIKVKKCYCGTAECNGRLY